MRTVDQYLDLITSYHRGLPKFTATVGFSVSPYAALQQFLRDLPSQFDLDTAIGAQEDVDGEWIGRSRFINTPLPNLYFTWGDPNRGWGTGIWKGPFDSDTGITRLDDDTYRLVLRAKIAANQWDGTVEGAKKALDYIFSDTASLIYIEDRQDMSVVFGVSQVIPSLLFMALLAGGNIPLKPEGVKTYYVITSVPSTPIFGWGVNNDYIGGWGRGSWGVPPSFFTD